MMKKLMVAGSLLFCSAVLLSCGSGETKKTVIKTKDGEVTVNNLEQAGEQMKDAAREAENKRKERVAKGDTLVMSVKDLQKYLPNVAGYKKEGEPGGESLNIAGYGSFSKADQHYTNGDKSIDVELLDYNQSVLGFSSASAMFAMNFQVENETEKSGSFDPGVTYVKGYAQSYKKEQNATVTYAIGGRFILTIKSSGSNDVELLKKIGSSMNLSELSFK